jgi:hypothetical protein
MKDLQELLSYILNEIITYEDDKIIDLSVYPDSVELKVFETEVPIKISYANIHSAENFNEVWQELVAKVDCEFIRNDLYDYELETLAEICKVINKNPQCFEKLLKKEGK